jgi:formamidopyrimidine-DNA glycosylase
MNLPDCLQEDPASHEPVSLLGFDPILSMPSLEDFSEAITQQKRSLKALLLDQVRDAVGS